MNELDSLRSQLRESKMRLREVRTENGELKIQYRRWLYTAVGLSMASMVICVAMMLFDSDPLADMGVVTQQPSPAPIEEVDDTIDDNPFQPDDPVISVADPIPESDPEPVAEGSTSLDGLEMPGWDEPEESKPEKIEPPIRKDTFTIPKAKVADPVPSSTGGFQLPGTSSAGKRVITHKVRKYDTLWEILQKYQGSPPTPSLIKKVMKHNSLSSSRIQPGSELIIILDEI